MDIRQILTRWRLRPTKSLGQNFLTDPHIAEKIVDAADLTRDDVALEIGAGLGVLTVHLAQRAGRVVAVEIDEHLLAPLSIEMERFDNVQIVQGDILECDPAALVAPAERYVVVANLPYYITSAVLRHVLEARVKPQRVVVTVQYEVAKRIAAGPGDMSLLAVSVQFYGRPQIMFRIKSGSFYPSPQVESAVVRIDLHPQPLLPAQEVDTFFQVVRAGFAQRRKQLHNTLAAGLQISSEQTKERLRDAGVDPRRRAQALSLDDWLRVVQAFAPLMG